MFVWPAFVIYCAHKVEYAESEWLSSAGITPTALQPAVLRRGDFLHHHHPFVFTFGSIILTALPTPGPHATCRV